MSLKVIINNSMCQIQGLNSTQHAELKEILSYSTDPQAHYFSGNFRSSKRYLIDNKGNFPTGLVYLVQNYLMDNDIQCNFIDKRKKPKITKQRFFPSIPHQPYTEQYEAARLCRVRGRGIICLPTGTGKTLVAALIINELQVRTLVVVPSLALKAQITETLSDIFGRNKVGGLGKDIAVENVDALEGINYDDKTTSNSINYDCIIIDEFHHSGAATYRKLNKKAWCNTYYKFGLTATPFRTQDHEKLLLESVLSQVIYKLDYETAVWKGYIVPVEAYYIDLPRKKTVEGYTWAQVYSELVVKNGHRNEIVSTLIHNTTEANVPTICLIKEVAHGYSIRGLCKSLPPFMHGESACNEQVLRLFNNGTITALVGTAGVLGEGVDTKPAEYIIIAGLGKSRGQFMQQVGRGLRNYPGKTSCKVIIFRDTSHKFTLRHYNQQVKILKEEYGIIPVRLDTGI